jgi:pyrroloquinoline-quinone synthase/pyrroloquinoline quinone biosynthesis protein D
MTGRLSVTVLLSPEELATRLRQVGTERYHNLHRFHKRLHGGHCSLAEVRAWALNRYYYQAMIPVKDATILARIEEPAIRRQWRSRIVDHDGEREGEGGIARWLVLTDSLGLERDLVVSTRAILPITRFAVDAYVEFCRTRPLIEAIASSLTELFSPQIISERIAGMLKHYEFVTPETLAYYSSRPPQARRDAEFALAYVQRHAVTPNQQRAVIAAL